jgi:hypothetical protein
MKPATYTLLVTVAPDLPPALRGGEILAESIARYLEEKGFAVAGVDAIRGDFLLPASADALLTAQPAGVSRSLRAHPGDLLALLAHMHALHAETREAKSAPESP